MGKVHRPRHGSLQYWPRTRSKKQYAVVRSWIKSKNVNLQGFGGYKAGMTHIVIKDNRPNSNTKGEQIVVPVTVVECPALKLYSIRFYKTTPYGLHLSTEILNPRLDKEVFRKVAKIKKTDSETRLKHIEDKINEYNQVKAVVYTQPKKSGLGKKTPEIFEIGIGGDNVKAKLDYAKGLFDKEIKVSDVFKQGVKIDVHAVTKGKGFQGSIKRFGAQLRQHKTEKKIRGVILGPTRPAKALWGIPLPGRMGYNLRTEFSKDLLFVGDKPEKVNPKGGFLHYGLVKSDYVLVKGSVPGPCKRLITLTEPLRKAKGYGTNYEINYVSLESKQ